MKYTKLSTVLKEIDFCRLYKEKRFQLFSSLFSGLRFIKMFFSKINMYKILEVMQSNQLIEGKKRKINGNSSKRLPVTAHTFIQPIFASFSLLFTSLEFIIFQFYH